VGWPIVAIDVKITINTAHDSRLLNAILNAGQVAKRAIPTYTNNTVSKQQAYVE